jgi:hypothetical protein
VRAKYEYVDIKNSLDRITVNQEQLNLQTNTSAINTSFVSQFDTQTSKKEKNNKSKSALKMYMFTMVKLKRLKVLI